MLIVKTVKVYNCCRRHRPTKNSNSRDVQRKMLTHGCQDLFSVNFTK